MNERPVALVTGSRKGIGRHLAERLVDIGYAVVGCSREPTDWSRLGYRHVQADVSQEEPVKRLFAEIQREFDRLDVTVNNVGVAAMNHSLLMPVASLDRIMSINVRGTFLVSRESAKLMRKRMFGRIVNLTSVAVPLRLEGESVYVASKKAIEGLTQVMSRELAEFGITVNAIGPSPIETDLIKNVSREKIGAILKQLAIKQLGHARDVSHVLEFLIRPESHCITGQVIYLGGAG